jgi:hypothetical protein
LGHAANGYEWIICWMFGDDSTESDDGFSERCTKRQWYFRGNCQVPGDQYATEKHSPRKCNTGEKRGLMVLIAYFLFADLKAKAKTAEDSRRFVETECISTV